MKIFSLNFPDPSLEARPTETFYNLSVDSRCYATSVKTETNFIIIFLTSYMNLFRCEKYCLLNSIYLHRKIPIKSLETCFVLEGRPELNVDIPTHFSHLTLNQNVLEKHSRLYLSQCTQIYTANEYVVN